MIRTLISEGKKGNKDIQHVKDKAADFFIQFEFSTPTSRNSAAEGGRLMYIRTKQNEKF
jgi:hypothetical protein